MRAGFAVAWRSVVLALCLVAGIVCVSASLHADPDRAPIELKRVEAVALVRDTLLRLNDANLRADYAALREAAAPEFQKRFNETQLAGLFAGMRAKHVDLTPAMLVDPTIGVSRYHTGQKILQLVGQLTSSQPQIRFALSYQKLDGDWKLYALALDFGSASQVSPVMISL